MREECSGPYLKMLIKSWPGVWIDQLKRMNKKVDEENVKQNVKGNVRYQKVRRFSSSEFWRTFVVSFQHLHLVLEGRGCGKRKRNNS